MKNYYKDRLGNRYVSDHAGLHNCKNTKFKLMGVTEDDEETGKWYIVEGLVGDDNLCPSAGKAACQAGCSIPVICVNTSVGEWAGCGTKSGGKFCTGTSCSDKNDCWLCCKPKPPPPTPPPAPPAPTPIPCSSRIHSSLVN